MAVIEIAKIRVRRGREKQTGVPQLDSGEFGWAQDTEHLYIGKRIVDGASDDNNTRILTENDLNYFKFYTTATVESVYKYRNGVAGIDSTTSTFQVKLDTLSPSLADFGLELGTTNEDITPIFRLAVQNLFANDIVPDARRQLIIPPGEYVLSGCVDLPPYAHIVGSGPGITVLTMVSTNTNMFRTVDATPGDLGGPFDFDSQQMASGAYASKNITIEGMTLQYYTTSSSTLTSAPSLVSLDNVTNARVNNVHFKSMPSTNSSSTYGFVDAGAGLEIRGSGGSIGSGDTALCQDIYVKNCVFDSMKIGILSTGSVIRPVITENLFTNLYQGIKFDAGDEYIPPSNGVINHNRFENIIYEGIYIGPHPQGNLIPTSHITSENFFVQVANGPGLDDYVTNTFTGVRSVIRFAGAGNKSVNDTFRRRTFANTNMFGVATANATNAAGNGPYSQTAIPIIFSRPGLYGGVQAEGTGTVNAQGTLTSVTITNPGRGYGGVPTASVNISAYVASEASASTTTIYLNTTSHIIPSYTVTGRGLAPNTTVTNVGFDFIEISTGTTATVNVGTLFRFDAIQPATIEVVSPGGLVRVDTDFYYAAPVQGRAAILDAAGLTTTLFKSVINEQAIKFPVTDYDQTVNIKYQVSRPGMSRSGNLLLTIAQDGFAQLTDNYNFTETLVVINTGTQAVIAESGVNLLAVDISLYPEWGQITPSNLGTWYITGTDEYVGKAAFILNTATGSAPNIWEITTDSADPTFSFTGTSTFSLLKDETGAPVVFYIDTSNVSTKNYVSVNYTNPSSIRDSELEYQVNILQ